MASFSVCGFTELEVVSKKHLELRRELSFHVAKDTMELSKRAAQGGPSPQQVLGDLALWEPQASQIEFLRLRYGGHAYYLLINPATEAYLRQKSIAFRHLGYVQAASEEPKGCVSFFRSHPEPARPAAQ